MGVTNVPVAPESRIAVSGGATTVVKHSVETSSLEVLTISSAAPPRQVEEGGIQKH